GDYLPHDERYARTEEFLSICRSLWKRNGDVNFSGKYYKVENARLNTPFVSSERSSPEIFIGGSSPAAQRLAINHATCWMRLGDTPEKVRPEILAALQSGIEVGLRMSIIARPTREEAVRAAYSLVRSLDVQAKDGEQEKEFVRKSDS